MGNNSSSTVRTSSSPPLTTSVASSADVTSDSRNSSATSNGGGKKGRLLGRFGNNRKHCKTSRHAGHAVPVVDNAAIDVDRFTVSHSASQQRQRTTTNGQLTVNKSYDGTPPVTATITAGQEPSTPPPQQQQRIADDVQKKAVALVLPESGSPSSADIDDDDDVLPPPPNDIVVSSDGNESTTTAVVDENDSTDNKDVSPPPPLPMPQQRFSCASLSTHSSTSSRGVDSAQDALDGGKCLLIRCIHFMLCVIDIPFGFRAKYGKIVCAPKTCCSRVCFLCVCYFVLVCVSIFARVFRVY